MVAYEIMYTVMDLIVYRARLNNGSAAIVSRSASRQVLWDKLMPNGHIRLGWLSWFPNKCNIQQQDVRSLMERICIVALCFISRQFIQWQLVVGVVNSSRYRRTCMITHVGGPEVETRSRLQASSTQASIFTWAVQWAAIITMTAVKDCE